jgi:hypothetical protein
MPTLRQQLVAQIKLADDAAGREFREVAGAADVASVLEARISTPSAFVIRGSSRRSDNGRTVTIEDQFLILVAVSNVRDARGNDSSDEAEALAGKIEEGFKGFTPVVDQQFEHLKLLRGNVLRWTDQVLVWSDIYQLKYLRRCCS